MAWFRRATVVAQIIGWLDIALFVIGIPGHIDDTTTWARWIALLVETPVLVVAIGFVVSGPLLWTSSWWLPRLLGRKRGQTEPLAIVPISSQIDSDLESFRACLPYIVQCRKLVQPIAGPLGSMNMGLQILNDGGSKVIELMHELRYLTRQLETLGIRHPIKSEPDNESGIPGAFSPGIWSMYLTELEVMIRHDDLAGARLLQPIQPTMQPISDTSDAQC